MKKTLLFIFLSFTLLSCGKTEKDNYSPWADSTYWYTSTAINPNYVDVFYIVSTEILSEQDEQGNERYIGSNTPEELTYIRAEMDYARQMFGDSVNFFSPYYHQFTFSAIGLPTEEFADVRAQASKDAVEAFRYYIKHMNNGRPFILAGFSQGSMHLIDILKQLTHDEYGRMVVSYSMGYRLSAADTANQFVRPAHDAESRGVVVSFNSVTTPEAIWPVVNADAATCINPINYRTDATPATFVFENDTLTVHVDTNYNVLIVEGNHMEDYRFPILDAYCQPGNLHHWDLLFYGNAIKHNAYARAYRKTNNLK